MSTFVTYLGSFNIRRRTRIRPTLFSKIDSSGLGITSHNNTMRSFGINCFFLNVWVRCTINRSHSTPCKKAEFEHLQIFPGHCLDFFLHVSGKTCHLPIKIGKTQHTLIISFSQHSPFFEEQSKNSG